MTGNETADPKVFARREARLEAEGWSRRNVIDEPRLSELVELYRSTGFEVHLEPVTASALAALECAECFAAEPDRFSILYVRPAAGRAEGGPGA